MCTIYRIIVIIGFVLILGLQPSWGGPPNNDPSDDLANTAGGSGALQSNTTGADNTAFGTAALFSNTTGFNDTASGVLALASNTTGINNTANGVAALYSNTTGGYNAAFGVDALYSDTIGANNTASGFYALLYNRTGNANTASGVNALYSNHTGSSNVAVGNNALLFSTDGDRNIGLGPGAGRNLLAGDNNIYLGNVGNAIESNTMHLGSNQSATFVAGIFGTALTGSTVVVTSDGQLGTLPSSARYKRDIHPLGTSSRGVYQLRPVSFRYKQDPQGVKQYGLIAEEVAGVYPELVIKGEKGEIEGVQYQGLIPLVVNEVQHQQQVLGTQARQLTAQSQELAALKEQNAAMAAQNAYLRAVVEQQQWQDEAQRA
jgi:hypothetical protein